MYLCFRCWAFGFVCLRRLSVRVHGFNDSIWRDAAPTEGEHILLLCFTLSLSLSLSPLSLSLSLSLSRTNTFSSGDLSHKYDSGFPAAFSLSLSLFMCVDVLIFPLFFPQDKFFSQLTGAHISDEDYRHAQEVCVHARACVDCCVILKCRCV